MDISAIGQTAGYTSLNTSQNINASGGVQSATSGGGGAPSGGASQASSASASSSSSSSSSTSSTSAVYDPRDLNKDGVVTYAEEIQYALMHPGEIQQSQSAGIQAYNQQGQSTSAEGTTQHTINVYA